MMSDKRDSRLAVGAESDHSVSVCSREVAKCDSSAKDISGGSRVERFDLLPESGRGCDASILGHVRCNGNTGKVIDNLLPTA